MDEYLEYVREFTSIGPNGILLKQSCRHFVNNFAHTKRFPCGIFFECIESPVSRCQWCDMSWHPNDHLWGCCAPSASQGHSLAWQHVSTIVYHSKRLEPTSDGLHPTSDEFQKTSRLVTFFSVETTSSILLGAKGIATRSKDATRGSWPYY